MSEVHKFEDECFKFELRGETYKVDLPSFDASEKLMKKQEGLESDSDYVPLMLEFLEELGLPKDVARSMQINHLTYLIDRLLGRKKN